MSAFGPKRTLPGYPTEIIPVRVHLMHLLRSLDAGRQEHLKHRNADRRPCQFVLRLPIERYSGGSAQRWPAITYLERKQRTRDRCPFATAAQLPARAMFVGADPVFATWRDQLITLAARYAIPTIFELREFVAAGGLMSYGPSLSDAYRLVGLITGQILRGAKPGALPVQRPTKFELVINLKTAKVLGINVPPTLLARADEVIE